MNENNVIAVLAALKGEIASFTGLMNEVSRKRMSGFTIWEGLFNRIKVRVVTTGVAAEPPIDLLRGCSTLLSTGFCGALRSDMRCGELVLSRSVAYADKGLIYRVVNPGSTAASYNGSGVFDIHVDEKTVTVLQDHFNVVHAGRTVTCARVIRRSEEKKSIAGYFDAHAIDLEDYGRLRIARHLRTPMWCIRAVLDEVGDTVPDPWSRLGPGRLSNLLEKISPAQQSISRMLAVILPVLAGRR